MLNALIFQRPHMLSSETLKEISIKFKELTESSPIADLDKNTHALIKSMLTKMELVSREEFDVQTEVLRNTREKLNQLEMKLATAEAANDKL